MIWVSLFCLSSQLLFQGTACATAEIVTAGRAGQETPVNSGLERSINPWWTHLKTVSVVSQDKKRWLHQQQTRDFRNLCNITAFKFY